MIIYQIWLVATVAFAEFQRYLVRTKTGHPGLVKRDNGELDYSWALKAAQEVEGESFVGAPGSRITAIFNVEEELHGFALPHYQKG